MGSTPVPRTIRRDLPVRGDLIVAQIMKTFLPWVLVVLALGSAYLFHAAGKSKAEALAKLEEEVQELEAVRAENAELKAAQVSSQELERLRKDNRDLLRLRNEIQQLRNANQQLTQQAATAQVEVQRAQAQAQAAQQQTQALATNLSNAAQQISPEMVAAFQRRYGIAPTPQQEQVNNCIRNLQTIQSAKVQWALENKKSDDVIPGAENLLEFFKDNLMPQCPAGGQYTLNPVSAPPTCTIPGHAFSP